MLGTRHHSSFAAPQYAGLLATLDEAASRAIGGALDAMGDVLCEPAVARILSAGLPPGGFSIHLRACAIISSGGSWWPATVHQRMISTPSAMSLCS